MRWLLRFIAVISLCVAVITAIVDAARSMGVSRFVFTPLGDMLSALRVTPLIVLHDDVPWGDGGLVQWEKVNGILLQSPVWLLFAAVALLFFVAGYRRRRS